MSQYYYQAQQFLKHGPVAVWIIMCLVLSAGLGYNAGLATGLTFLTLFFGLGSLIIGIFGYRIFPAIMELEGSKLQDVKGSILLVAVLLFFGLITHIILPDLIPETIPSDLPMTGRIIFWLSIIMIGTLLLSSIQLTNHYYQHKITEAQHEADKAVAELNILKNQINPHFLFNTLNNIYGLAYMGDMKAAEMISKLSRIMRYLIYDCDQEKVLLVSEKELIRNYLDLQSLKHEEQINIDFYEEGIQNGAQIPPMILINFVENCFKHSDVETNPDALIQISLELNDNQLSFKTLNTTKKQVEKILFEQKGIGLKNSKKLLEAHYPNQHELVVTNTENTYSIDLTIQL